MPGSPEAKRLAATIRALAAGPLPGAQDVETPLPPAKLAWVRRVPRANLWIYFTFDDDRVFIGSVVRTPPVPRLT